MDYYSNNFKSNYINGNRQKTSQGKKYDDNFNDYNNFSSIFKEIPTENQLLIYQNIPNLIDFYHKVPSNELVKSIIFKRIKITKISNKSFRVKFQYPQTDSIKFNPSIHSSYIRELEIDGSCQAAHIESNLKRIIKYIYQNDPDVRLNKLIFDGVVYSSTMDQLFDINFLFNLCELEVKNHLLMQIPVLSNLQNLGYIDLSNNNIISIGNLDHLINLKTLNLSFNKISQINGLDNLVSLEILNLSSNQIAEISNLSGLTNLRNLNLSNNKIIEIKNLVNLFNLQSLDLSSNPITELRNLNQLTYLAYLDLSNLQIKRIRSFDNLINLQILNLSKNRIKHITGLTTLHNLKQLNLSKNYITRISGLTYLYGLDRLDLSFNQVRRISGLRSTQNLSVLNLKNNKIRRIEGLESLQRLEFLDLSNINNDNTFKVEYSNLNYFQRKRFRDNQLININTINFSDEKLKKITYLYELFRYDKNYVKMLSQSEVTNFRKMLTLLHFNQLIINGNNISEIRGLENLHNLRELNLSFNMVNQLKNLSHLSNLNTLNLMGNQITTVSEELHLPRLEHINLSYQNNFEFPITDAMNNTAVLNYNKLNFEMTSNFFICFNGLINLKEINLIGNKINVADLQVINKNVRIVL